MIFVKLCELLGRIETRLCIVWSGHGDGVHVLNQLGRWHVHEERVREEAQSPLAFGRLGLCVKVVDGKEIECARDEFHDGVGTDAEIDLLRAVLPRGF